MGITERIDNITRVGKEYWSEKLPAPKSVKIEISPRCNYRCGFCALRTREHQPLKDMDFGLFKRITEEMKAAGVEEIGLFYLGESFMNPPLLIDCIKHCKAIHIPYVFLTTNGSLCKPKWLKGVFEAGLDSLKFSCNTADEAQFKDIVAVSPKYFKSAINYIREAKKIRDEGGYKCGIYASSIKYDGEQQARMEAFLKENVLPYVDEHYFLPLYQMGMYAEKVKQATGFSPTHGNSGRIDETTGLPNRMPIPCWSVFKEGHVRADGHLSVCCFGADDRFDAGDLNTQPFMEAWNSPLFLSVRAAHLKAATCGPDALRDTMCRVCVAWDGGDEKSE